MAGLNYIRLQLNIWLLKSNIQLHFNNYWFKCDILHTQIIMHTLLFIYSLPITPQFHSKRHARQKQENSMTTKWQLYRSQVCVVLLLFCNQIYLLEMQKLIWMRCSIFEEDEKTLGWKSTIAKEEKLYKQAIFSSPEHTLMPLAKLFSSFCWHKWAKKGINSENVKSCSLPCLKYLAKRLQMKTEPQGMQV